MLRKLALNWLLSYAAAAGIAHADTIVQEGSLSGYAGEPISHDVVLDQFDDMDGTRVLNFVQMNLVTSLVSVSRFDGLSTRTSSVQKLSSLPVWRRKRLDLSRLVSPRTTPM